MKTSILKKVLFVIMLFVCHSSLAHDFEVNGIYYGISIFNKNTAYVTHRGTGYNDYKEYSGSVVIPESVTYNGKSYTVASIGGYAFYGCDELTSVTIPGTVNTINQNAFNGCTGLMDIECRATTPPALGDNAFTSYTATLKVPESSESEYKSAAGWKNFKFPENIGDVISVSGVTYKVISNTEVEVVAGTTKYSGNILIPNQVIIDGKSYTVTRIGEIAFYDCKGLISVIIPNSVTSIGDHAFSGCEGLTSVTISNSVISIGESAFYGCEGLTSITIPNSVTSIGTEAFSLCTGLTSLEIGKSVSSIGNSAFFGCSGLTSVVIGHSVSSIGYSAFSGCNGLTSVTSLNPIPPTCETNVFGGVNTQNIPLTVPNESILKYRVADTWKDFKFPVTIGDVVEYEELTYKVISETAVEVIAGATKYSGDVVIPNQITIDDKTYTVIKIGDNAFNGCTDMTSVSIPNSVTSLGSLAFNSCTSLTSVTIPNSVTSLGVSAFNGCSGLMYMVIPKSVTSIEVHLFSGCINLSSIIVESANIVYDSRNNCNAIIETSSNTLISGCKTTVIPNSVTSIGWAAFSGCTDLANIAIPSTITYIDGFAFQDCVNLKSVFIPNSVTSIGKNAFTGCTGLTSVTSMNITPPACGADVFAYVDTQSIPLSVPAESVSAYQVADTWKDFGTIAGIGGGQGTNIGDVVEYEGLTYKVISETAVEVIAGATKYTGSIVIPNEITIEDETYTVSQIGEGAFKNCSGLTSVTIPNTVTSIGDSAFQGCFSLTNIEIPNSVTSIGDDVFCDCVGLTSVTIGNSVASIGNSTFYNCTSITTVYITDLEAWCKINFGYYSNPISGANSLYLNNVKLTNIEIPNTITEIKDYAFFGYDGLTSVTIGESVISIGESAFQGCDGLTNVIIPNSIISIGESAFYYCSGLTSITIGNSVASIGKRVFYDCTGLKSVTSLNPTPPTCETNVFGGVNTQNVPLMVPAESVELYKSADTWKDFGTITGIGGGQETNIGDVVEYEGLTYKVISETEVEVIAGETEYTGNIVIPSEIAIDDKTYTVSQIGEGAFKNCGGLTTISIPNTITIIGNSSFYGCTGLMDLVIPHSVISIGDYAFYSNGLKNVEIGNSVTSIGYGAFSYCSDLTSVSIGESVRTIGEHAFSNCSGLTSVTIGNSVTTIGKSAFWGCFGLTSVEIGNSVISIGECAFQGCGGLTSVNIPNSVISIGDSAFSQCYSLIGVYIIDLEAWCKIDFGGSGANPLYYAKNLYLNNEKVTNLEISSTITVIKKYAFINCSNLTSITIPNSVTTIGKSAFWGCFGLTSVTSLNPTPPTCEVDVFSGTDIENISLMVPAESVELYKSAYTWKYFGSITGIGGGQETSELNYNIISDTEVEVVAGETKYTEDIVIPSETTLNGKNYIVTRIGERAFSECTGMTSVKIPNSVTSIGYGAFEYCTGLTSIAIPSTVMSIERAAFEGCKGLASITIPKSVTSIGVRVFSNCISLTSIVVESGNTVYDSRNNCNAIIKTSTNTLINACKTTVIPNSVTSIENFAFESCTGLTSITIPNSVTRIGLSAFESCTGLTSITIGNSVTRIEETAFEGCTGLTNIVIPNSVTSIDYEVFSGCTSLMSVVVEKGNTVYDSRDNCNAIIETATNSLISGCKTTVIPNSITSIGYRAFIDCTGLTHVVIPEFVTSIGIQSFSGCTNLTSITIGNSVSIIGFSAFYGCNGLASVTSLNPTPPTCVNDVFENVDIKNITLSVPSESVSAYKVADTWKDFGTIVAIEGAELPTEPTLEELWVHDMTSSGNAVRNAVCIGDQIAVTDISFSGGSDRVLFYNAIGKMDKNYDVGAYIKEHQIGGEGDDGIFTRYDLGRGIAVDEVGNIIVNLCFTNAKSSTNFVAIAPNSAMKHIVCEVPSLVTAARADFIDVEGDIFNNAYIALALKDKFQIAVYNIKNGVQDVNNSYTVEDADLSNMFTNETKVIFPTKNIEGNAEYASEFYVYDRHYRKGIRYSDGYHSLVAKNEENFKLGNNDTNTGATAFEVNGTTYIVMPTSNSSGMRANAFKIINVETGEVVVTSQGAAGYTDKTNYAQDYSAWVNEDGTVNIAQLVQGTYLAMYKFYPGKDTSISIGANMNMSVAEETLIDDEDEPIEYYNLNGVRVQNPSKGVYIKRQGGKVVKTVRSEE